MELAWDANNLPHATARLTAWEIESVLNDPATEFGTPYERNDEPRLPAAGPLRDGRIVVVLSVAPNQPRVPTEASVMAQGERKREDRDPESGRIFVESVDEIPVFSSDDEEVAFWETHEPTMKLLGPRPMSYDEEITKAQAKKDLPRR